MFWKKTKSQAVFDEVMSLFSEQLTDDKKERLITLLRRPLSRDEICCGRGCESCREAFAKEAARCAA